MLYQTDRIQRYRNIEPDSALFLAMQIRIQQSKSILEIGTSTEVFDFMAGLDIRKKRKFM